MPMNRKAARALAVGVLSSVALSACLMPQLSREAESVRIIETDPPASCRYLGEAAGRMARFSHAVTLPSAREDLAKAYDISIKNETARRGGNTAVRLARQSDGDLFYDLYAIYVCR